MIRPLPPAPSRDNPGPFASQSDALLAALAGFVEDANRLNQSLIFVGTTGQSATPLAVGAGTKTLTASTGKAWVIGAWLHLVSAGGIGNVMVGQVLAYDVDTGGLQVNVGAFAGSGTHSDWLIGLSSPQAPITAALIASGAIAARVAADGGLLLPGNAVNALEAVPKQQAEAIAAATRGTLASLSVTVNANAMTATLQPETLDFRSSTLSSGTPVSRTATAAATLTVPSAATLGTVNGQAARIVWGWLDNAGTLEPFVANLAGGVNLDETTLISTTAISGTANSAGVIYSQTARTNVAFRVRGFCDITEATAGTWATAPTLVQGAGGQALAAMSSLGYGQTWQNLTASRAFGTTYYNTTGKPIFVFVSLASMPASSVATLTVGGVTASSCSMGGTAGATSGTLFAVIPPSVGYSVANGGATLGAWSELR